MEQVYLRLAQQLTYPEEAVFADGKWSFETPDFEIDIKMKVPVRLELVPDEEEDG